VILLTGASGVVGRAVAEELRADRVVGLVHRDQDVPEVDEAIAGDIAAPRFGLTPERWERLAVETDAIVHSAALTEWGRPWDHYEAINLGGTRQAIELAGAAGAPVHLISTAFVHALECGHEDDLADDNVVKPYIRSKLASERLLGESGVPHSIFRPTNIIGDSRTGASHRPQIVQVMSSWICRGKAPYFPVHRGNLLDIVTLDVLAAAIAGAVEAEDLGGTYWVTNGPESMTAAEGIEVLVEHAAALGREIEPAPLVDPRDGFPVPLERVPPTSRAFLKVLMDVSEVTHYCGGTLPTSMPQLRERFGVRAVVDVDAFRLSLEFWSADRAGAGEETVRR